MSESKHLVVLSDYNYLKYGLTLYDSLEEHDKYKDTFILHYLCTDEKSYEKLCNLQLPNIKTYNIKELEDDEDFITLKSNHNENNTQYSKNDEFHWALASFFSYYLIDKYELPHVLYVDADILFYEPVDKVFNALENKSIGLITHKHTHKHAETGYYNVGIVFFDNNETGKECLKFWRDCCIDPNNEYSETHGTCGDQKYLELFEKLFDEEEIKILCHDVGNLAPWNLHMCKLIGNNEFMWYDHNGFVLEPNSSKVQSLVFMHFSHFTPDFDKETFKLDRGGEWGPIGSHDGVVDLYKEYYIKCSNTKKKYKV